MSNQTLFNMKSKFLINFCLLFSVLLILQSCKDTVKENSENDEKKTEVIEIETKKEQRTTFDPSLDPLKVGEDFSKIYGDTLNIQMYEVTFKPGDSMGLHEHLDHTVYVLEGGKLLVYFNGTDPVEMELTKGMGFVSGPIVDAAVNVGETDITLLLHEILRPRE